MPCDKRCDYTPRQRISDEKDVLSPPVWHFVACVADSAASRLGGWLKPIFTAGDLIWRDLGLATLRYGADGWLDKANRGRLSSVIDVLDHNFVMSNLAYFASCHCFLLICQKISEISCKTTPLLSLTA